MNLVPNISVETGVVVYPLMIIFGLFTYCSYKFTRMYYESLIETNYELKKQPLTKRENFNSYKKYYVIELQINNLNELFTEEFNEMSVEEIVSNMMSKLNCCFVHSFENKFYFVVEKDNKEDNSDFLIVLFNNEYKLNENALGIIPNITLKNFDTGNITLSKFFGYITNRNNYGDKQKNIKQYLMKNAGKNGYKFYKFNSDHEIVIFKLRNIQMDKNMEELITSDYIETNILKYFKPFDIHYIEIDSYDVYKEGNEGSNENEDTQESQKSEEMIEEPTIPKEPQEQPIDKIQVVDEDDLDDDLDEDYKIKVDINVHEFKNNNIDQQKVFDVFNNLMNLHTKSQINIETNVENNINDIKSIFQSIFINKNMDKDTKETEQTEEVSKKESDAESLVDISDNDVETDM